MKYHGESGNGCQNGCQSDGLRKDEKMAKPHQRKDGRWAVSIEAGWTKTGTRRRITVYGHTKRECMQNLRKREAEIAKQGAPEEGARRC